MSIGYITQVFYDEVHTSFERMRETDYDGVFTVHIPVRAGYKTEIKIALHFTDTLSMDERDAHRFPPDLPVAENWPYTCRVTPLPAPPFWAAFATPTIADHVQVKIQVFALHGIKIDVTIAEQGERFVSMDKRMFDNGALFAHVAIDKMCRPETLPATGDAINSDLSHPIAPITGATETPVARKLSQFIVRHVPNGVDITWLGTQQTLSLRLEKPLQGDGGFIYFFNPSPNLTPGTQGSAHVYDDLLHIKIAGDVSVSLTRAMPLAPKELMPKAQKDELDVEAWGTTRLYDRLFPDPVLWEKAHAIVEQERALIEAGEDQGDLPPRVTPGQLVRDIKEARFFRIERVASAKELEPYGQPFLVKAGTDDEARNSVYRYIFTKAEPPPLLLKIAFDVIVGEIPVIGMMADYAEFNVALATGKDRWGDEVGDFELALMGASILPIIGLPFELIAQGSKTYRRL